MRKWTALLMAVLFALTGVAALAEEPATNGGRTAEALYEEVIIGSTTAPSGNFFSDMWGSNTADLDVRALLHGYSLVEWRTLEGMYATDGSVVTGMVATQDEEGNKTYTLALAEDLAYSDGTRITARDYAFSILLSAAPQIRELGGMTGSEHILGAEAYSAGTAQTIAGVRVVSDYMLEITVKAEYLPFFYELALLDYSPFPIQAIAPGCEVADAGEGVYIRSANGDASLPFTAELLQGTILDGETGYMSHPAVTSGPYVLTGYDAQTREAAFAINPYFKGTSDGQKPTIERLTYKPVRQETMIGQLLSGEVDVLNKCTQAEVIDAGQATLAEGAARSVNYMRGGLTMISFTCEQGPMQYQSVRQAIALCLDRDRFIEEYVGSYGMAVDGYYGIGQWMTQLVNGMLTLNEPDADADEAAMTTYNEQVEALGLLTLEALDDYAFDTEAAKALLTRDGWTLNEAGEPYAEDKDAVRCKLVDGALMPLSVTLAVPEGNAAEQILEEVLAGNLSDIGVRLTIEAIPFSELLERYYRQQPRGYDMFYLGTNFQSIFDLTNTYSVDDAHQGVQNTTGLRDERLAELAQETSRTEAGDLLTYCQRWLDFQTYWNGALPAIPLYSNVYFDFYTPRLQNYAPDTYSTCTQALVYAYLGDVIEEEAPEEDTGDSNLIILMP